MRAVQELDLIAHLPIRAQFCPSVVYLGTHLELKYLFQDFGIGISFQVIIDEPKL